MKLGIFFGTALALSGVLGVACTTTETIVSSASPDGGNADTDGSVDPDAVDEDNPANQPPHSLGSIVLGESHASGGSGKSTPIVTATFVPDATLTPYCKTKLEAGCTIQKAAKCTANPDNTSGCESGEYCTLDTKCAAVCKKLAVCEEKCEADEVCTAGKGTDAPGTCVKTQTFDAGPIAFSGTTTAITLFPPYKFEGDGSGAPFLAGSEIRVQGQGASGAGFEKFDEKFTSTTFLQTTPALNKITREKVFGTGPLPIAWVAGADTILVTVAGAGGSATCKVQDSLGKFDLPRSVLTAAIGDTSKGGTAAISLTVQRQKKDIKKDKVAKGTLTAATVQPVGWLELVTLSTESTTFQGCSGTQSICGDTCSSLQTDPENCGTCGNVCPGQQECNAGKCGGSAEACNACVSSAQSGTCSVSANACQSDAACSTLASCIGKCGGVAACVTTCRQTTPAGTAKLDAYISCLNSACAAECN